MLDAPAPLRGLRVLVVEDEPLVALMLEDFVQDLGCRFFQTAGSTPAALEVLETIIPDVVILDLTLAGAEPDFAVADALVEKRIPFIFSSGHHRDILPARYRARPFLAKPFSMVELAKTVSAALSAAPV